MPLDYDDYTPGRRAYQIDHDARLGLGAFRAFIALDEAMSIPGHQADDSLTAARDGMRASACDELGAHLSILAGVADAAGLAIGADLWAASDRLQALYDATDGAKRIRENRAAEARFRALAEVVRPVPPRAAE